MEPTKTEIRAKATLERLEKSLQNKKLALHILRRKRWDKINRLSLKMSRFDAMRSPTLGQSRNTERKLLAEVSKNQLKIYNAKVRLYNLNFKRWEKQKKAYETAMRNC